jgi:transposase
MIRQLKVAHDTAVKHRSAAMITLKAMIVHAPELLRAETARKTQRMIARHCAAFRPRALETPEDSIRHTLRSIAKRWLVLDEEIQELVAMIESLVMKRAPHLLEEFGIGVDTAAEILIVAGDNSERIHSEAAFAKLAGVSPVPTGSGMTSGKHRINHGGHRQLNAAIYRTVIVRMQHHEPTKAYVARRTTEGKSKRDIIRCLKRYVIGGIYQLIKVNPRTGEIAC